MPPVTRRFARNSERASPPPATGFFGREIVLSESFRREYYL